MAKEIKVKQTFIYGFSADCKIIDEDILTFPSVEAFEKYQFETAYRLGWEGGPLPDYEIINEQNNKQNNESNKI